MVVRQVERELNGASSIGKKPVLDTVQIVGNVRPADVDLKRKSVRFGLVCLVGCNRLPTPLAELEHWNESRNYVKHRKYLFRKELISKREAADVRRGRFSVDLRLTWIFS